MTKYRRTRFSIVQQHDRHQWLILNMADTFAKKTGRDIEEMLSIGNSVFMLCCSKWNHTKGAFSTWLCKCLKNKMIDHVRKNDIPLTTSKKQAPDLSILPDRHYEWNPVHHMYSKELGNNLSTESRFIIGVLLSEPCLLLDLAGTETPKQIRGALHTFLKKAGWTQRQIWNAFREIKGAIQEQTI